MEIVLRSVNDDWEELLIDGKRNPNGVFLRRDYIESGDRITAHYYPASLTVFEWQEDSALVCD